MHASRLVLILALLAAFVAGMVIGGFVSDNPAPPIGVKPFSKTLEPELRGDASNEMAPQVRGEDRLKFEVAGESIASRLAAILAVSDENVRHREWLTLLPSFTSADAPKVRELFRQMKAQGRRFEFEWATFWPRWGELDGAAAMERVSAHEAGDVQASAAELVLRGWARADHEAARAWFAANPSASLYGSALRGYLDGSARSDLARATRDALALGQGREMGEFVEVLVEQALQQRQIDGMLEWWATLPADPDAGSARAAAVAPILSRLGEVDPARAQTWITELAATPYREEGSIGSFAERLAEKNPAHAVAWVASLPPSSDGHYTGIGRTVRAWAAADQANLERWVASLPPSPLREQAVAAQQEQQTLVSYEFNSLHQVEGQLDGTLRIFKAAPGAPIKMLDLKNNKFDVLQRK